MKINDENGPVTTKNGMLYNGDVLIPLPEADEVARKHGYQCAEQFVRALHSEVLARSPLAKARDSWFESPQGIRATDASTLGNSKPSYYLRNRLESAFIAGSKFELARVRDYVSDLEECLASLILVAAEKGAAIEQEMGIWACQKLEGKSGTPAMAWQKVARSANV